jgi:hypothetical protein
MKNPPRPMEWIVTSSGCWEIISHSRDKDGYGCVQRNMVRMQSHRYAYILAHGNIPKGMIICHTCDNPPCINPEHLFLGTVRDNTNDKLRKERQCRGETIGLSKLTNAQVIEIRTSYIPGPHGNIRELEKKYPVKRTALYSILTGYTWKHLLPSFGDNKRISN